MRDTRVKLAAYGSMKDNPAAQAEFASLSVKLKEQEAEYRNFCRQTGLAEQNERLRVVGFNRSLSQKAVWANKKDIEKYSRYHYNKDGTIVVTDVMKSAKAIFKPFAIVQINTKKGGVSRYYYDSEAKQVLQIDNNNHGKPKCHPYGEHGEHHHVIIWKNGKITERIPGELTDKERKENADIL